jgi:acetylornithine/succinyldiaminopimelate/putrescine aminotransferase
MHKLRVEVQVTQDDRLHPENPVHLVRWKMEDRMIRERQHTKTEIIDRFARHVSSGKAEFFAAAGIDFVAGDREGIYLSDLDGRRLINCHCNGGVFNLGHRNPRLIAALQRALPKYDIGNHHLLSAPRALLAERLAALSPGDLNRVVFGVSGGEAIDLALKLARAHTRRPGIISALGGYHGHTGLALAAGDESYRKPFEPLSPGFTQVPFGDLQALEAAMRADTAAVIFETIPATLGIAIPPEDYFAGVRRLCNHWGTIMIIDEVQTGLGRCGRVWGIDTYGVIPDILVTAKGLSGGIYPITATLYSDRLDTFLHDNPFIHISTFGGAEVGCFVALEVLDMLQEPGFLEHVRAMATTFQEGFASLLAKHPQVLVEVRQRGLMMGLKLANPGFGPWMTAAGFQAGLLAIYANNDPSVLQILPPLIIQEEEAHQVLAILDSMLRGLETGFDLR